LLPPILLKLSGYQDTCKKLQKVLQCSNKYLVLINLIKAADEKYQLP